MREAGRSRSPPAWTPTTPSSAAISAKPITKRNACHWMSASMPSPRNWTPRIPPPGSTMRLRNRPRIDRWRPCTTCKNPSNSTTTGRSTAHGCCSMRTWRHAAPALGGSIVIWASSNWPWWRVGSRSTPIQRTFPPTGSWPIRILSYPATRSRRVSELLQSQLLQPINITPIQPRLADSNLFLISAAGPGALSFNEFNPLFNRNRIALQTSSLVGDNSTYGGEGIISGIYNRASFSIGGSHFSTDGFRTNDDQSDNLANAFVQFELTPSTSLQAEYQYRNVERGDLRLRFFPEDFFRGLRTNIETNTYRMGLRHAFVPEFDLLGSFIYQAAEISDQLSQSGPLQKTEVRTPQNAFSGEIQHLFRSRYVDR